MRSDHFYRENQHAVVEVKASIGLIMNDSLSYSVAIIADIHGNVSALNAVIEDLQSQPYDRLVVAGDLVLNGPRPVESLDAIRNLGAPTIYGNADLKPDSGR